MRLKFGRNYWYLSYRSREFKPLYCVAAGQTLAPAFNSSVVFIRDTWPDGPHENCNAWPVKVKLLLTVTYGHA